MLNNKLENEETTPAAEGVTFDRAGWLTGVRQTLGIGVAVFAYGLVFGLLARQAGLSLVESLLMSGLVFAGASEFTALGLWALPLPIVPIILTTLIVNLRHILMGAAVYRWFRELPAGWRYLSLFFLSDESWALTMSQFERGKRNGAFLLGSGVVLFAAWLAATGLGGLLGSALPPPERLGLDFAFTAVFLSLLVGMWKGRSSLLPWGVAAIVAIAASLWLPGKWYILLGGLAGSLAGAFGDGD